MAYSKNKFFVNFKNMFWSYSNIFIFINILLWLFTFIFYQNRRKYFGAGSLLLLFYLSIAVIGLILFNHPYTVGDYKDIKLFPFLYLYAMLIIASLPVLKFKEREITHIQQPSNRALNVIYFIVIIASLLQLGTIVTDFSSGLSRMLLDNSVGSELYGEMISNYDKAGDRQIKNLPAIISNLTYNICILLLFYNLTRERKNKYIILGLSISVLLFILSSIAVGGRGGAVNTIFTVFITYILLRNLMSDKIRKKVRHIGIIIVSLIAIPVILITISRFGGEEDDNDYIFYSMQWYYGQAFLNFNNYGLDANGIRNGDRTASLFKQIIWDDTPKNYLERREKYSYMEMDESVFYTFVGDFTLDYGPYISFLIFAGFCMLITSKLKIDNQTILFHQLVLLYLVVCICMQGAMSLFPFADMGGNLTLITFILVYFWFKIDYNIQLKKE